mgnify:CR=1 FL=1
MVSVTIPKEKIELSMLSEKLRQIESVFEIERTTG